MRPIQSASILLLMLCLSLLSVAPWQVGGQLLVMAADTPAGGSKGDAEIAMKKFRVPAGLSISVFAAEPQLTNPVAFCLDEKDRIYVVETNRLHAGVTDTRGHMYWLDDDLACRTVADRLAMYRKHLKEKFATYGIEHDRVRRLEDTDGDGRADRSTVFAEGFNDPAVGLGAGVLARGDSVWFTCIPDLWLLSDKDNDGKAESRKSLHQGYGVHVGFIGHDLHGLRMGPDGKLYFSIGDRGLNVTSEGVHHFLPDQGAVLRCNPDGTGLEVFATGLRNPQELAFDRYGNLFTCDNNSDGGDRARWIYVVPGGDSGWQMGYQYIEKPNSRGPWNAEKMWHPQHEGQPAAIVPPLVNFSDGPSGLTYNPGVTQLPERYQDHFFLADFRGGSGNSGIRSFAVKPKGAAFELVDSQEFLWSVLATDVDFGADGALYVLDWIEGWGKPNKGRIYRLGDPQRQKETAILQVKKLLGEGMTHRSAPELAALLEHPDMRIRQEAQFALAARDDAGTLSTVAVTSRQQMARVHAMWGLEQLAGRKQSALDPIRKLTADADPEIRAQAARVLGEGRHAGSQDVLVALLQDSSPRVQLLAALALARVGPPADLTPVLELLRANADQDAYLRHGAVMALAAVKDPDALLRHARDDSPSVRLGVLLALRRKGSAEVARFLDDSHPRLVVEAARAINDVPIVEGFPPLARLSQRTGLATPALYRAINANFRLGRPEHATAVAALAARSDVPLEVRVEAVRALGDWAKPSGRDRVMGSWRPLPPRPETDAIAALRPALGGILAGPDAVRQEGVKVAARLGIKDIGPALFQMLGDASASSTTRAAALAGLEALKDPRLADATQQALIDTDSMVRTAGRRVLARLDPERALEKLEEALSRGTVVERQGAFSILGSLPAGRADRMLADQLDLLLANKLAAECRLDILQAAEQRQDAAVKQKLGEYLARRSKTDPLAQYRETLFGGNSDAGQRVFLHKAEVSCLRCHKLKGEGGDVGPDLSKIGSQQQREYLLEAIVDPNRQIAKGFDTVVLLLKNGQIVSGVLKGDNGKLLQLMSPEGKLLEIPRDAIEEQKRGPSAMPQDAVKNLSMIELRDLVEFLANQK